MSQDGSHHPEVLSCGGGIRTQDAHSHLSKIRLKVNGGAAALKAGGLGGPCSRGEFEDSRLPQAISAPFPHLHFYPSGGVTEKTLQALGC